MSPAPVADRVANATVRRARDRRGWPTVAWVALVAGAGLRVEQYLSRRSLWVDEALLAGDVVRSGFGAMLHPFADSQSAPVGFLWAERATALVLGNNEYALRLLPLAGGLAVLVLTHHLARAWLGPRAAAVATALTALSPGLLRYSTEVKQYSTDAAVALGLVALARWADARPGDRRAYATLGAAGAAAVWMSHPAALVLAGVGAVLAARRLRSGDESGARGLLPVWAGWATSFAVLYAVSLRHIGADPVLKQYWAGGFPPRPPTAGGTVAWLWRATGAVLAHPGGLGPAVPVALGAALGAWVLAHRQPAAAALVAAPLGVLLVASALGRYPARDRLLLFAVPLLILLLAASAEAPGRLAAAGLATALGVAVVPAFDAAATARRPTTFAESRPVFEYVRDHLRPGDAVHVHDLASAPYAYYGPVLGLAATRLQYWQPARHCPAGPLDRSLGLPAGRGRVWLILAYRPSSRPPDEHAAVRSVFDSVAHRADTLERPGASATLYEFGGPPDDPLGARRRTVPGAACLAGEPLGPATASGLATGPFGTGRRS